MTYLGKTDHQCFTQGHYREMFQDVCDLGPASQKEGVGSRSVIPESLAHGVPGELSFFKVEKQQRRASQMCYFVAPSPDVTLRPRGHVDDRKGCTGNTDSIPLVTRQRCSVSLVALTRCFCTSTKGMRESPAVFFSDSSPI